MERIRRARNPFRAALSRQLTESVAELRKPQPSLHALRVHDNILDELMSSVAELDQQIRDVLLDDEDFSEDVYETENSDIFEFQRKFRDAKEGIREKLQSSRPPSPTQSLAGSGVTHREQRGVSYRLPKIELRKFHGDLLEWLGFWAQFSKIHEDREIHDTDKFHYLLQATVEGSRAREIVDGFPLTAENYPKAVSALKERYGKPKLQKQVYVRELLHMIVSNTGLTEKFNLSLMYTKLECHLRALESLGVTTEVSAEFLFPMVESCLPEELMTAWQRSPYFGQETSADPTLNNELDFLMLFLRKEVENQEHRMLAMSGFGAARSENSGNKKYKCSKDRVPTAAGLINGITEACIFCQKGHPSTNCFKAQHMTLDEKCKIVKEKRACFCCFRAGHRARFCKTRGKCAVCHRRHHQLVCPESSSEKNQVRNAGQDNSEPQVQAAMCSQTCTNAVLLKTQLVEVSGSKGKRKVLRILFDSGSQRSYVKRSVINELGCKQVGEEWLKKSLFGGGVTEASKHRKFRLRLKSLDSQRWRDITVLDEPNLCSGIPGVPYGPWIQEFAKKGISFSDQGSKKAEIDIVIGNDFYEHLLTGQREYSRSGLIAVQTIFGWTLSGSMPTTHRGTTESTAMIVTALFTSVASPAWFWSLEVIGIMDPIERKTREEAEMAAKVHFLSTVERNQNGRYSVCLPWIGDGERMGNNRVIAEKRLLTATTKLIREHQYEAYEDVFKGWLDEGIIEEVNDSTSEIGCHYLPHRAVFKPESVTTPVRPVFDASCKSGRNPSLNECLEKGPNLLALIPDVLLRFREGKIGVIADIRKAFLMIKVKPKDRDVLRFLWWENFDEKKFKVYRHKRVVFGVNCSPFLLAAVIEYHLESIKDTRRPLAMKLLQSLYVDNVVASVNSLQEYKEFESTATKVMAEAQMELRQWERTLLPEDFDVPEAQVPDRKLTKVLGLSWDKCCDSLQCDVPERTQPEKVTKRTVLSRLQQYFDPIGFLAPALIVPKLIVQRAWNQKSGWDDELPDVLRNEFEAWCDEAPKLAAVAIPRELGCAGATQEQVEVHTFCDASKLAYATVVFLRVDNGRSVTVRMMQAKSRVAPLKLVTTPRLELLACTIAARLTDSLKRALSLEDVKTYLWSDSTTALAWIRRNDLWGTFVGNRVKEICKLTKVEDWHHVPGIKNPADLPSRGCTPGQLLESKWWDGPEWLKRSPKEWPAESLEVDEDLVHAEKKRICVAANIVTVGGGLPWYMSFFSSYRKCLRVIGWVCRFLEKAKKISALQGNLTVGEIVNAELTVFRMIQKETFSSEESVIAGLRVLKDEQGLLRVKTKLIYRDDSSEFRLPVLLPSVHPWVNLLIREEHCSNGHAGIQILMGKLREKCWIIQGRKAIRKVLSTCIRCLRHSAKSLEVTPAPLPADRVNDAKPFQVVGVDFAGPLHLKDDSKVYIVLFTCAVYRCLHLELVESMGTKSFLLAFQRFISRRGNPQTVYSDNAKSFVGAAKIIAVNWSDVEREAHERCIQWKFNPPTAAWWGGWWERLVCLVKDLLKRILGRARVNFEEMHTIICQVESTLNSRPLTYVTEDPNDLVPLTPAMFLMEQEQSVSPATNVTAGSLRRRYRYQEKLREEFKMRFRKEYLSLLVQRGNSKVKRELNVGDIVLVKNDAQKRIYWPLAKVIEMLPGQDQAVRLYKVKTENGLLLRPAQKLCPLEISSQDEHLVNLQFKK